MCMNSFMSKTFHKENTFYIGVSRQLFLWHAIFKNFISAIQPSTLYDLTYSYKGCYLLFSFTYSILRIFFRLKQKLLILLLTQTFYGFYYKDLIVTSFVNYIEIGQAFLKSLLPVQNPGLKRTDSIIKFIYVNSIQ